MARGAWRLSGQHYIRAMSGRWRSPIRLIVPVLLSTAMFASSCHHSSSDDIEATLKQLETEWETAEAAFDADTVARIMSDEWVGTEPDGTRHRKNEELSDLREHKGTLTSFRMDPIAVTVFGETAIVRAGSLQQGTGPGGDDASGYYVWTDVFIRRNGVWKVVASHTSRIE
jgi:ketosteroid isomerase-like protein